MRRISVLMLFCLSALPVAAQLGGSDSKTDPKDALGWFERANNQMNLRTLGSAPFHMKVKFHAFPGIELLPPEKSQIVTGDGAYEETWISPSRWRREVTLGSYHAIETHNESVRKMQASSDYEPSRVLMLMDALLNPISRSSLSPELQEHRLHWKTEHSSVQGHSFVRISTSIDLLGHLTTGTAYVFVPEGLLLQSNESEIVTTREDDVSFAGKVVPRHISIQAGAVRDLLTAEVAVEKPGEFDSNAFDLPGGSADPAMTLRPLHKFEVRREELISGPGGSSGPQESLTDLITHCVIDRRGAVQELEVIYEKRRDGPGLADGADRVTGLVRQSKYRPSEIDGSPCEIAMPIYWVQR